MQPSAEAEDSKPQTVAVVELPVEVAEPFPAAVVVADSRPQALVAEAAEPSLAAAVVAASQAFELEAEVPFLAAAESFPLVADCS